jgi:hypothetical protein
MGADHQWTMIMSEVLDMQIPGCVHGALVFVAAGMSLFSNGKLNWNG